MRGPKPKPTALKIVNGNPGHRPLPKDEPRPEGDVVKPAFVKAKAARLWNQYAPELERLGILTSMDVDMFGTWCCLMAEFQGDQKNFGPSKMAHMRGLAASFGMDPSARVRLGTPAGKQREEDKAEKYFKRSG